MVRWILITSFVFMSSAHASPRANCKITSYTLLASGSKEVDIDEIYAASWLECKQEAAARERVLDEEGVSRKRVAFGYRGELRDPMALDEQEKTPSRGLASEMRDEIVLEPLSMDLATRPQIR